MPTLGGQEFMSIPRAASELGVSPGTLERWREGGKAAFSCVSGEMMMWWGEVQRLRGIVERVRHAGATYPGGWLTIVFDPVTDQRLESPLLPAPLMAALANVRLRAVEYALASGGIASSVMVGREHFAPEGSFAGWLQATSGRLANAGPALSGWAASGLERFGGGFGVTIPIQQANSRL